MKLVGVLVQGQDGNTYTVGFETLAKLLTKASGEDGWRPAPRAARRPETARDIIATVARYFGLLTDDIMGDGRHRTTVLARAIAMRFTRERLNLSLPEVGKAFGGRDHNTVLHALRRLEQRREAAGPDEQVTLALQDLYNTFNPMFPSR